MIPLKTTFLIIKKRLNYVNTLVGVKGVVEPKINITLSLLEIVLKREDDLSNIVIKQSSGEIICLLIITSKEFNVDCKEILKGLCDRGGKRIVERIKSSCGVFHSILDF